VLAELDLFDRPIPESSPMVDIHDASASTEDRARPFLAQRRLAPGDPEDSLIWVRINERSLWQMPPLATSVVDPDAELIRAWIEELDGCP